MLRNVGHCALFCKRVSSQSAFGRSTSAGSRRGRWKEGSDEKEPLEASLKEVTLEASSFFITFASLLLLCEKLDDGVFDIRYGSTNDLIEATRKLVEQIEVWRNGTCLGLFGHETNELIASQFAQSR